MHRHRSAFGCSLCNALQDRQSCTKRKRVFCHFYYSAHMIPMHGKNLEFIDEYLEQYNKHPSVFSQTNKSQREKKKMKGTQCFCKLLIPEINNLLYFCFLSPKAHPLTCPTSDPPTESAVHIHNKNR